MRNQRLLSLPLMLTVACATVQQGPLQRIHVESKPSAALIEIAPACGGGPKPETARTPATLWVSRRATKCNLTLSFPGYHDTVVALTRVDSDTADGNFDGLESAESLKAGIGFALFGLLGLGVDSLTGAIWMQSPSRISATLIAENAPEETGSEVETSEHPPEDSLPAEAPPDVTLQRP